MMFLKSLTLACIASLILSPAMAGPKPTRSECIIGFKLDWSGVKGDPADVRNSWDFRHDDPAWWEVFAGYVISPQGKRLYLQFAKDCDRKAEMAAELIESWRSKHLELPNFERLKEPIIPSPWTIDIQGEAWRDGGMGPGYVRPEDVEAAPNKETDL
jgi:hypothetical protein